MFQVLFRSAKSSFISYSTGLLLHMALPCCWPQDTVLIFACSANLLRSSFYVRSFFHQMLTCASWQFWGINYSVHLAKETIYAETKRSHVSKVGPIIKTPLSWWTAFANGVGQSDRCVAATLVWFILHRISVFTFLKLRSDHLNCLLCIGSVWIVLDLTSTFAFLHVF